MNNQAVSDAYPKLENVQAWMDPLSETFRSLDLVHALNSFLHKLLSPSEHWRTAGGFLVFVSSVSASIYYIVFFDAVYQTAVVPFFPPLIVDNVHVAAAEEPTQAESLVGWLAILALGVVAYSAAIYSMSAICHLVIIFDEVYLQQPNEMTGPGTTQAPESTTTSVQGTITMQGHRPVRDQLRYLFVASIPLFAVVALYHYVADTFFPRLRLVPLSTLGILKTERRNLANLLWCLLVIVIISFCYVLWGIYKQRKKKKVISAGPILFLIGFILAKFIILLIVAQVYCEDYFDETLKIKNPIGAAWMQVFWIAIMFCVASPVIVCLLILQNFVLRDINAADLSALQAIFDNAGIRPEKREQEITNRVTLNSSGRVTSLNLSNLTGLRELSTKVGRLETLSRLSLEGCIELTRIPAEVGNLKLLTKLNRIGCTRLAVPPPEIDSDSPTITFLRRLYELREKVKRDLDINDNKLLLFAACLDPTCASALGDLCAREPKELSSMKDENGRTLFDVACSDCKQQIRKAQLFFSLYEFDMSSPMYKSESSLVYFADDYSDAEKREVVLKFVYSMQDLKSELNARNVGKFDDDYVISVIRHHNGDEEPSFLEAVKKSKNQLPSYCIVLQRGERNLLEQINAISISKKRRTEKESMNEVRNRGEELAKCLKEVHKKKFIHGDFKLKNVVLDAESDKWKLIDFDSSVNYQEARELRGKISTAFAPPELVTKGKRPTLRLRQGSHAPNEPDVNVRKDWKPLAPHPSYDVWSFGAVLFHLIMGEPLFNGQDHLGNLDENGLNELGNWSRRREERLRELGAVDLTAKRLLEQVLDPNWKKRPSMEKILDHDFFHPGRLVTKINDLRMEKQQLEEELGTARNDSVFIEEVQKKLDNINRQLHGLESTMTHRLDSIESQVVKIALQVSSLRSLLVEHQIKTTNMLTHLLEKTKVFPRFVIMIPKPTENESKWWKLAIKWTKPGNWVNKEVQIYFVCPITLTRPPDTEGYSTTLRRDWVVKYGPALLVTLRVLQVACAVGRLTGLPLPNVQDVKDMTADLISDHAGALSTMYNSLREELGDVGDLLESKVEDYVHIPSAPSDIGGLSAAENAVQRSYGEIMEIAKQAGDPELEKLEERCGLVRAYKSDQSTSAYVRKDAAQLYARLGDKAFHLREEDLKKELNVIIV